MNVIQLYFKLIFTIRTPFVLFLDWKYKSIPKVKLKEIAASIEFKYKTDYSDCDDFAIMFKAKTIKGEHNAVGIVWGWWGKGLHLWNVAITPSGTYQIEPQNGKVFTRDKRYHPFVVII